LGWGGIGVVARVSGASRTTVSAGVSEVRAGVAADGRVRAAGAGRPPVEEVTSGVEQALEELIRPGVRGDPGSLLQWTTKSAQNLAGALCALGFQVGRSTAARLVRKAGYRLQGTGKCLEKASHPDRDAQFRHINATAVALLAAGEPVVSVDTKKKESAPRSALSYS
jgi:hypothetical protein